MIQLKNKEQLALMKKAGRITGEARAIGAEHIKEGVSTYEIDMLIREYIERQGAKPSFLGYAGFPASACISINDEVIHGIPSRSRILQEGDIVKIDVGAYYMGYHGDCAGTFPVGKVSKEAENLIEAAEKSFRAGVEAFKEGNRIGDVGSAIDKVITSYGFSTVRKYIGHGIGQKLHEAPDVPNFGTAGRGPRLFRGMTLAIEPMLNAGGYEVKEMSDGWTVKTLDGSLSAHYENSVALTDDGIIILTEI